MVENRLGYVPRVIVYCPSSRMCKDYGRLGDVQHVVHGLIADMGNVNHDAKPVKFMHQLLAEFGQPVPFVMRLQK